MLATVQPADEVARSPDDVPERLLGEDGARAYRRFLEWNADERFALAVIEIKAPVRREALVAWTLAHLPRACVVKLDDTGGKSVNALLVRVCSEPAAISALLLTRLEEARDRKRLCAQLNVQRDQLVGAFPRPWVMFVHPSAATDLRMHAPDFYDFAVLSLRERTDAEAHEYSLPMQGRLEVPTIPIAHETQASKLLDEADLAITFGRYDHAEDLIARYDLRYPDAREREPRRIRLEALLHQLRGESSQALRRLRAALELCDPVADARMYAALSCDIGRILLQRGVIDEARSLFERALHVFEDVGESRLRAMVLGDLARMYARGGKVDAALELYGKAREIFDELGDRRSWAVMLQESARLRAHKGDVDAAFLLLEMAGAVFDGLDDRRARAVLLSDIADLRGRQGDWETALAYYEEALNLYDELRDVLARASALAGIARARAEKGDVEGALKLLDENLRTYEEHGDPMLRAATLGEIATLRAERGEFDSALGLYEEQLAIFEALESKAGAALTRWLMGRLLYEKGEKKAALEHLTAAVVEHRRLGHDDDVPFIEFDLGLLFLELDEKQSALTALATARDGLVRSGRQDLARNVQELLDAIARGAATLRLAAEGRESVTTPLAAEQAGDGGAAPPPPANASRVGLPEP